MQQTEKYKLNLIEPSDPFLPDALNANTQQLENVVSQHLDDMDQRVTVLEGLKVAYGAYQGDNVYPRFIPLPFTPKMVLIEGILSISNAYGAVTFAPDSGLPENPGLKVAEGGFQLIFYQSCQTNSKFPYCYIAFA